MFYSCYVCMVCLSCSMRFFTRSPSGEKNGTKRKKSRHESTLPDCIIGRFCIQLLLLYGSTLRPCPVRGEKWINKLPESFVLLFTASFFFTLLSLVVRVCLATLFSCAAVEMFWNKFPQLTHVICASVFVYIYGFSEAKAPGRAGAVVIAQTYVIN